MPLSATRCCCHRMIVIAEDTAAIEPVEVGSAIIHPGQRYDVLLCQRQAASGASISKEPVFVRAAMIGPNAPTDRWASSHRLDSWMADCWYCHCQTVPGPSRFKTLTGRSCCCNNCLSAALAALHVQCCTSATPRQNGCHALRQLNSSRSCLSWNKASSLSVHLPSTCKGGLNHQLPPK